MKKYKLKYRLPIEIIGTFIIVFGIIFLSSTYVVKHSITANNINSINEIDKLQ